MWLTSWSTTISPLLSHSLLLENKESQGAVTMRQVLAGSGSAEPFRDRTLQPCRRRNGSLLLSVLFLVSIRNGVALTSLASTRRHSVDVIRIGLDKHQHQLQFSWNRRAALSSEAFDFESTPSSTTSSLHQQRTQNNPFLVTIDTLKHQVMIYIGANELQQAYHLIQEMFQFAVKAATTEEQSIIYSWIHSVIVSFAAASCSSCVAGDYRAKDALLLAADCIIMFQSKKEKTVGIQILPSSTVLRVLRNLFQHNSVFHHGEVAVAAFGLLQILSSRQYAKENVKLLDKDYNTVLKGFCDEGRMDMAHRVVALREVTSHAPPLSAVAYSILVKGHGRLGELEHLDKVVRHAEETRIVPDTIFMNSLVDAYINCGAFDRALSLFAQMKGEEQAADVIFPYHPTPKPNHRTYNTILKGMANEQNSMKTCLELAQEMKQLGFWDPVTTNTLVHAAVKRNDFSAAELLLSSHTVSPQYRKEQHPNVEAYTELLDGYAKSNRLDKAVATLETMHKRGVMPNQFTYSCMLGGFGRYEKTDEAKKLLAFLAMRGEKPSVVVFNALFSGLVGSAGELQSDQMQRRVDEAFGFLGLMTNMGIKPNPTTATILVEALGRCPEPRVLEATVFVKTLEEQGVVPQGHPMVATALIRVGAAAGDIKVAIQSFQSMKQPDLVAVNAFLDACYRCNRDRLASETFEYYFQKKQSLVPDVVSYSTVITSLLRKSSSDGVAVARKRYSEMRSKHNVAPDRHLVDSIIRSMIRFGQSKKLEKRDVLFIIAVLRDAEQLSWGPGQLERRKRAVRAILGDRLRDAWKFDSDLYPLLTEDQGDELFRRKGWNKVDSGFRLWFAESAPVAQQNEPDEFLRRHGWNDVDSGFRIV